MQRTANKSRQGSSYHEFGSVTLRCSPLETECWIVHCYLLIEIRSGCCIGHFRFEKCPRSHFDVDDVGIGKAVQQILHFNEACTKREKDKKEGRYFTFGIMLLAKEFQLALTTNIVGLFFVRFSSKTIFLFFYLLFSLFCC
jgi:hypothetical protein